MKKLLPKPIVIVTALIVGIAAVILLPKILKQNSTQLLADIPQIEESSDPNFDYKFEASTFELLMGEENGKPKVRIHQGIRGMDIIVENQNRGQSTENIEPSAKLTPTPISLKSLKSTISLISQVSPIVSAQENLNLVNTETESTLEYVDQGFTLTPTLDIVTMEFEVVDKDSLPTLIINPLGLTPYNDVTEVVFQTRTNRKAFMFKNAVITDYSGNSQDSELLVQGHTTSDPTSSTDPWYDLRFVIDEEWLSSLYRTYPATITVEVESLFHERMLPVQPVKSTFKSYENLEFTIDTLLMEDPVLTYAIETEDFDKLRFGLIDTGGKTHELKWKVKDSQVDQLTIELWLENSQKVAGLFDLLIQYENNNAYIGESEFSWGVLTINPDQSVYQSESPAKIDMAVLDKNGLVICSADLILEIEDPLGTITAFSTETETITITEGCFKDVTDLPDYTTTYQTSSKGIYKMTLIAETNDGIFTIKDQFEVDDNSPFYVKRRGPTRIYPWVEYDMVIEILTASVSGAMTVTEVIPDDFIITPNKSGSVQEASGNIKTIVWKIEETRNSLATISYTFDAPDVSPAIFLLGPVKIGYGDNFSESWQESRQWQIANDANTVDTENDTSTQYESSHWAFRNPVGNQNYYTFYQNAGSGGRRDGVYAWSATGTGSWTTDIDPGANDVDVGSVSGVDMFAVGTTMHAVYINPDFNNKVDYVHGSVATGVDDFTWGSVQDVGSCETGHNNSAAIDSAGRVWFACAKQTGDSFKLMINADSNSSDPGSPPDAPTWTGENTIDDTGSVQKYVNIVNIGNNAVGFVYQDSTSVLGVGKATISGGSITVSSIDTLTSLTMTAGLFSLVSDNSTNGHVLYEDGTNLVHRKIDFFDTNPVFGGTATNVLTESVDSLALSHNSTDSEIVAFYVKTSDNTDIWWNSSDDSTISFGTESEIDDGGSTALTNLSAGRTDWNDDSNIQLTYGYVSTGTVRFHEVDVGPATVGPTTEQIMRHGNWFDSGVEQGFFWAD